MMRSDMQRRVGLIVAWGCYSAVKGAWTDSIVLFGDSLSDNGNGYAGNAKFVLRTNQVTRLSEQHI